MLLTIDRYSGNFNSNPVSGAAASNDDDPTLATKSLHTAHMHIYICICIHLSTFVYIYMYIYMCVHVFKQTRNVYIYTYIDTHICIIYVHAYIHTYICRTVAKLQRFPRQGSGDPGKDLGHFVEIMACPGGGTQDSIQSWCFV